jgi:DNA replication protein DnaC
METTAELKHLLKTLRLSPLLSTLPERVAYAKGNKLTHLEFLELLLSDEVERRSQGALQRRLQSAKVDHDQVLERFDWEAKVTLDRDRLKALIGLEWVERWPTPPAGGARACWCSRRRRCSKPSTPPELTTPWRRNCSS